MPQKIAVHREKSKGRVEDRGTVTDTQHNWLLPSVYRTYTLSKCRKIHNLYYSNGPPIESSLIDPPETDSCCITISAGRWTPQEQLNRHIKEDERTDSLRRHPKFQPFIAKKKSLNSHFTIKKREWGKKGSVQCFLLSRLHSSTHDTSLVTNVHHQGCVATTCDTELYREWAQVPGRILHAMMRSNHLPVHEPHYSQLHVIHRAEVTISRPMNHLPEGLHVIHQTEVTNSHPISDIAPGL